MANQYQIGKRIEFALNFLNKKSTLNAIGKLIVRMITVRTRTGFGVARTGAARKRLAKLSKGYIEARKGKPLFLTNTITKKVFSNRDGNKAKYTTAMKLSGMTSASKSNLTQTGEMIDNLTHSVSGNKISVSPSGRDAKQKAEWAEDGSSNRPQRPFLHLSNNELKQIRQFIQGEIGKALRQKF